MKVLYITTVGGTMSFFCSIVKLLLDLGNQVDIATNENEGKTPVQDCFRTWGCKVYHISCDRAPLNIGNIRCIGEITKIVSNNKYDIVHCHTPIAASCARIACNRFRKNQGLKVFYTAHGFHFYNGASITNWFLFYPIEKILSFYTDVLITITREDYKRAKKKLNAKKTVYIPGVGIDVKKFKSSQSGRIKVRTELGLSDHQTMILSVGELNDNKNHEAVIRAIKGLNLVYVIVGKGKLKNRLERISNEENVDVRLMGFRNDVADFYSAADLYVLPSIREGLNVSIMEAMASGLPIACSRIRGNVDLIDSQGGLFFNPYSIDSITCAIEKLIVSDKNQMATHNSNKVKQYDIDIINRRMCTIYNSIQK